MAYLAAGHLAVDLDALLAELRQGRVPRGGRVLVTLDDGARDACTTAWPILRHFGIPATVFVPAGLVGQGPFWWNRLYRLAEVAKTRGLDLEGFLAHAGAPLPRSGMRERSLWNSLRQVEGRPRDDLLAAAAEWLGEDGGEAAGPMSRKHLEAMDGDSLITIGAQSFSHTVLAGLDAKRLALEVAGSREELEGLLSFRAVFAYPCGDGPVVDAAAVRAVHEGGFEAAFTTAQGSLTGAEAPLLLGRLAAEGLGADDFPHVIDHLLGA
jgi:peptidoglycan/xylan/chitin deacetylase (PgdA/CDA1 family)